MAYIQMFVVALIIFFLVDMLWLGVIAKNLYQKKIGFLLKDNVNWVAAIIFYLLFIGGVVFFVLIPAQNQDSALYAFLVGGLFGLITYATYDLTNLATVKNWPLSLTFIDLAWGSFLGFSTAGFTYLILTIF